MKVRHFLIAVPTIVVMVALVKAAQYAAIDTFGSRLGFDLASFIGTAPVILLYFIVAARLPKFSKGKVSG